MTQRLTSSGEELVGLLVAGHPIVIARLRADHVPGDNGRCRGCRNSQAPIPVWPCTLRVLADHAAALLLMNVEGP